MDTCKSYLNNYTIKHTAHYMVLYIAAQNLEKNKLKSLFAVHGKQKCQNYTNENDRVEKIQFYWLKH